MILYLWPNLLRDLPKPDLDWTFLSVGEGGGREERAPGILPNW